MTARGINKLTALQVKTASPDKMYKLPDGGNLYLRIDSSGSKYWIFNSTRLYIGKRNDLSLDDRQPDSRCSWQGSRYFRCQPQIGHSNCQRD